VSGWLRTEDFTHTSNRRSPRQQLNLCAGPELLTPHTNFMPGRRGPPTTPFEPVLFSGAETLPRDDRLTAFLAEHGSGSERRAALRAELSVGRA
jgi:hypothetical protein